MGFFPAMCVPAATGRVNSFQVNTNHLGEVAVYSLDDTGKATDFTCTKTGLELLKLLADKMLPGNLVRISVVPDDHEACWSILGTDTWEEAAKVLNGKSSAKRSVMMARYESWSWYQNGRFVGVRQYLKRGADHRFEVTDLGRKRDSEWHAQKT